MNKLLTLLNRYRNFLILLAVVGIFGYTARQISLVVNSSPDPVQVEQQRQAATAGMVKIDTKTINTLGSLSNVNGNSGVSPTNKPDPFSP